MSFTDSPLDWIGDSRGEVILYIKFVGGVGGGGVCGLGSVRLFSSVICMYARFIFHAVMSESRLEK